MLSGDLNRWCADSGYIFGKKIMDRVLFSIFLLVIFSGQAFSREKPKLCTQFEIIENYFINKGALKDCKEGSVVHLQVNPKNVAYSFVVSRYCNFDKQIIIERHPTKKLGPVHIVCEYQFHE